MIWHSIIVVLIFCICIRGKSTTGSLFHKGKAKSSVTDRAPSLGKHVFDLQNFREEIDKAVVTASSTAANDTTNPTIATLKMVLLFTTWYGTNAACK